MNKGEITRWLTEKLATRLHTTGDALDIHAPLDELGVDSMQAVALTGELETWLGRRIEPTLFWDSRTLWELAEALADGASERTASTAQTRVATMSETEVDAMLRNLTSKSR